MPWWDTVYNQGQLNWNNDKWGPVSTQAHGGQDEKKLSSGVVTYSTHTK